MEVTEAVTGFTPPLRAEAGGGLISLLILREHLSSLFIVMITEFVLCKTTKRINRENHRTLTNPDNSVVSDLTHTLQVV